MWERKLRDGNGNGINLKFVVMSVPEKITIHGSEWKYSDVAKEIELVRKQTWKQSLWKPSDALVHKKGGVTSLYVGQKFDPKYIDLIKDGWTHDHCEICWWTLFNSEKTEENSGYSNGRRSWLCSECFEKLVRPNQNI